MYACDDVTLNIVTLVTSHQTYYVYCDVTGKYTCLDSMVKMYVYLSVTSGCAAYEYMYTSVGVALVAESPYLDVKFVYLVMFNLFQWVGYTMVFTMLIYRVLKDGPGSWLSFKICFRKIIS